jgi:integrase
VTTLPGSAKLTPARIAKLITTARQTSGFVRHAVADEEQAGLFLVIGKRTASWTLKYRPRGLNPDGSRPPPTAYVIGDVALVTPEEARAEAQTLRAGIAKGGNPVAERAQKRAQKAAGQASDRREARRRADMLAAVLEPTKSAGGAIALDFSVLADATLVQCAAAYGLHGVRGSDKTRNDAKAHILRGLAEMNAVSLRLGDLKQAKVSGLARLHEKHPATGRHRLGALSRLYKWLCAVEAATSNPVAHVALPRPPAPRSRVLTAAEVRALWQSAEMLPTARRDYLRLLLLLPLRRQELADTRRADISANGDRLELVVAPHRAKNGAEHRLPLVGETREIVERLLEERGEPEDFLIQLSREGTPMNSWRRFSESIERASGVKGFAFHDTRRLFASEAGEHDLADFSLIDAALNHLQASSKTGAARAYHHARHANARVALMTSWALLVNHAVANGRWPRDVPQPANVVPLNARAAK